MRLRSLSWFLSASMDAVLESHRYKNAHALRRLVFSRTKPHMKGVCRMSLFALCASVRRLSLWTAQVNDI